MALTQMQLIQSLGEAMSWFERELSWKVPPTELRHLCGRIGELYAAMITNGQMAPQVNQKGYDVVGANGERISVKTTATAGSSGHCLFNSNTLQHVDRIIVLRINTEEMQIETPLDASVDEAIKLMVKDTTGKLSLSFGCLGNKPVARSNIKTAQEVIFRDYTIRELESGSIEVEFEGRLLTPVKPALRDLATALNIGLLNDNGNLLNTR